MCYLTENNCIFFNARVEWVYCPNGASDRQSSLNGFSSWAFSRIWFGEHSLRNHCTVVLLTLFALIIVGCKVDPKEDPKYKSGYSDGFDVGMSEGRDAGYQEGLQARCGELCQLRYSEGVEDGRAAGFTEGYDTALPKGWSPEDEFSKLLLSGPALAGAALLIVKFLAGVIYLIQKSPTNSGKALNSITIFVSSMATLLLLRLLGGDAVLYQKGVLGANPASSFSQIGIVTGAAVTTFLALYVVVEYFSKVENTVALMIMSVAMGILSTFIAMAIFAPFKVDNPLAHVVIFLGIGLFLGSLVYGCRMLLISALQEERRRL